MLPNLSIVTRTTNYSSNQTNFDTRSQSWTWIQILSQTLPENGSVLLFLKPREMFRIWGFASIWVYHFWPWFTLNIINNYGTVPNETYCVKHLVDWPCKELIILFLFFLKEHFQFKKIVNFSHLKDSKGSIIVNIYSVKYENILGSTIFLYTALNTRTKRPIYTLLFQSIQSGVMSIDLLTVVIQTQWSDSNRDKAVWFNTPSDWLSEPYWTAALRQPTVTYIRLSEGVTGGDLND